MAEQDVAHRFDDKAVSQVSFKFPWEQFCVWPPCVVLFYAMLNHLHPCLSMKVYTHSKLVIYLIVLWVRSIPKDYLSSAWHEKETVLLFGLDNGKKNPVEI